LSATTNHGLVDRSHPNDIGFTGMADGLEPILRETLGLLPSPH